VCFLDVDCVNQSVEGEGEDQVRIGESGCGHRQGFGFARFQLVDAAAVLPPVTSQKAHVALLK